MTKSQFLRFLCGSSVLACAMSASAHAQTADGGVAQPQSEQPASEQDERDIVVTGTLLRGIAPTGTNVIGLSRQDIIASGATSANDVLTKTPQVTSAFLGTPTTTIDGAGTTVIRPNLRNLGGSGANTTLVLMDGHRMVGAGGIQTSPDPDVIPPGALERVDIVPDGGSSIYGSDAIGGVINFITRRKFDGLEVTGRYGFADDYNSYDINVTAGKDWGTGSGYVSYAWAHNDAIFGRTANFLRQITDNRGFCAPGTIIANGTTYALPTRQPGTITNCDITDPQSYWPQVTRHTVFGSLNQQIGEDVTFGVRGFYSRRQLDHFLSFLAMQQQSLTVPSTNFYFQPIAGETSQVVRTTFSSIFDNRMPNSLQEFGVTPTIEAELGGGWQLRLLGNYAQSTTEVSTSSVNTTGLAAALRGTTRESALNPYDPAASDVSVVRSILRRGLQRSEQELINARAIIDGPLFSMAGGDVKLAVGAEYTAENYMRCNTCEVGVKPLLPPFDFSRNVKAIFGEVNVPLFGGENAISGIHSLTLAVSGRYDSYSDVGDTFNPKIGVTYEPVEWITLRGNWGKSFNAPSLNDNTGVQNAGVQGTPLVPGTTAPYTLIIAGNDGQLRPQTATTWSIGADIQPPVLPGLTLSATYYNIHLKDTLGLLLGTGIGFNAATSAFLRDNQTCAQVAPLVAGMPVQPGTAPLSSICTGTPPTGPLIAYADFRLKNLGLLNQSGLDFSVDYKGDVGFGTVSGRFAGTYTLSRDRAIIPGTALVDDLKSPGNSRLSFVASAGVQTGGFSGQASLNHRAGYSLTPPVTTNRFGTQREVDGFTTIDLFFSYALPESLLSDTTFTLNVTNLLDQDPPFYNSCIGNAQCGFTNGSTLGRLIQLGIRKKF